MKQEINTKQYHHTQKQIDLLDEAFKVAYEQYAQLMKLAKQLYDAQVKLDGTQLGADGDTVRNGANNNCYYTSSYLLNAANEIKYVIHDRDYWDLIRFKNNFVGGRFISDAEMKEKYQHCLDMIPELEKKFNKEN